MFICFVNFKKLWQTSSATVAYAINNIFCVDGQLTELQIYARLNSNFIPSLWLLLQMKSS